MTLKLPLTLLPLLSVAVHVTGVVPMGKALPETGEQFTTGLGSVLVGGRNVEGHLCAIGGGGVDDDVLREFKYRKRGVRRGRPQSGKSSRAGLLVRLVRLVPSEPMA